MEGVLQKPLKTNDPAVGKETLQILEEHGGHMLMRENELFPRFLGRIRGTLKREPLLNPLLALFPRVPLIISPTDLKREAKTPSSTSSTWCPRTKAPFSVEHLGCV